MLKVAFYGKGGIGKSTTCANVAVSLANMGRTVLQIGCDPKADSTALLHKREPVVPLLTHLQKNPQNLNITNALMQNEDGVFFLEAGGPIPGLGCAGRGIGMVLEYLTTHKALATFGIDCVLYDVLGDVVCGGFSMPMRKGYANHVVILTSGETMSLYAANNIAQAIKNFSNRSYAHLAGIVHMQKNLEDEEQSVKELTEQLQTELLATIPQSPLAEKAAKEGVTAVKRFPESDLATIYRTLAQTLLAHCDI